MFINARKVETGSFKHAVPPCDIHPQIDVDDAIVDATLGKRTDSLTREKHRSVLANVCKSKRKAINEHHQVGGFLQKKHPNQKYDTLACVIKTVKFICACAERSLLSKAR